MRNWTLFAFQTLVFSGFAWAQPGIGNEEASSALRIKECTEYGCKITTAPYVTEIRGEGGECIQSGNERLQIVIPNPGQILYIYDYTNTCDEYMYARGKVDGTWYDFGALPPRKHMTLQVVYPTKRGDPPSTFIFSKDYSALPDQLVPSELPPVDSDSAYECDAGNVGANISGYSVVNAENLTVSEEIPVVGTSMSLTYSSGVHLRKTLFTSYPSLGGWMLSGVPFFDAPNATVHNGDGTSYVSKAYSDKNESKHIPTNEGSSLTSFFWTGHPYVVRSMTDGQWERSFSYNDKLQLHLIEDRYGNKVSIEFPDTKTIHIISQYGQRTILTLDNNGLLQSVTNPMGQVFKMVMSPNGLLTSFERPNGRTSFFEYDASGRLLSDRSSDGRVIRFEKDFDRDRQTQTTKVISPEGRETFFQVKGDHFRRLKKRTAPFGGSSEVVESPRQTTMTDFYGSVSRQDYVPDQRWGWVLPSLSFTSRKVPNSKIHIQRKYENRIELIDPKVIDKVATIERTVTLQGDESQKIRSKYVAKDSEWTMTTPEGRTAKVKTEGTNLLSAVQVGDLEPLRFEYDSSKRPISVRRGSRERKIIYDSLGNIGTLHNEDGRDTTLQYDQAGRLIAQLNPDGSRFDFNYDTNGNLTGLSSKRGGTHSFEFDAADRPISYLSPERTSGEKISYSYNRDNQITSIQIEGQKRIDFQYGADGLLTAVTGDTAKISYEYHDKSDLLSKITTQDQIVSSYKYSGNLLTEEKTSGTVRGGVRYVYSEDGSMGAIGTSGKDGKYSDLPLKYDKDGFLISAGDFSLKRDHLALVREAQLGKIATRFSYDSFGVINEESTFFEKASLFMISYERDLSGRLVKLKQDGFSFQTSKDFEYDSLGRLTQVRENGQTRRSYEYDENGNRVRTSKEGSKIDATYDKDDRLLSYGSVTFEYSASGQTLSKTDTGVVPSKMIFSYDDLGNLVSVQNREGLRIDYVLDARNRRIGKKINGKLVQGFIYQSQTQIAAETDGSGKIIKRFVYGSRPNIPDYMIYNGKKYRVISDQVGTPIASIDAVSGKVLESYSFDEFGFSPDLQKTVLPFGLAGGLLDKDTGLIRFGAREYDPEIGRWLTKDPLGFAGGQYNLYAYVNSDPVNFFDPAGTLGLPGAIVGGVFGAIGGALSAKLDNLTLRDGAFWKRVSSGFLVGAVAGSGAGFMATFATDALAQMSFDGKFDLGQSLIAGSLAKFATAATKQLNTSFGSTSSNEIAMDIAVSSHLLPKEIGLGVIQQYKSPGLCK